MTGLRAAAVGVSGSAASGASSQRPCPGVSPEQLKGLLLPGAPRGLSTTWLWSLGTRRWGLPTQGDPCLGASSQGGQTRFAPPSPLAEGQPPSSPGISA